MHTVIDKKISNMSFSGKEINQRINNNLLKKVCRGVPNLQRNKTRNRHQLTDTFRALSFKAGVTFTLVTARCVLTRRMFHTPAVIFRTLIHVCAI